MRKYLFLLSVIFFFTVLPNHAKAQSYGQNKVVVSDFKWQIIETPHFYVYYYQRSEPVIKRVVQILETGYLKITKDLSIEPSAKIPFFLYATHNDFEQTNISDVGEGVGGFTEIFKNRFVVPVNGSDKELQHVIEHELTHALVFELFYGGHFWRSIYLFKSLFYPLWFLEGLSEHESAPYDITDEMILRDAVLHNGIIPLHKLLSFDHLQGNQIVLAYKEGQSALNYLAEKYGRQKVSEILYLMKDAYDASNVLNTAIKKDIFKFQKEWEAYLKTKCSKQVENKKDINEYGQKITSKGYSNQQGKISPDGKKLVFISDRRKFREFYLAQSDGTKQRPILNWYNRRAFDTIGSRGNLFAFSPDSQSIVFAAEKTKKSYLFIYQLDRHRLKKIKTDLDEVSSPNFSPDGQKIVFAGLKNGYSDLYLIDVNGKNLQKLTGDSYDDSYPVFAPDGKKVFYVSEREHLRHLYWLELDEKEGHRLTDDAQEEIGPSFTKGGEQLIYIGSEGGIYNIFLLDLATKQKQKLTDVNTGVLSVSVNEAKNVWLLSGYRDVKTNLYLSQFNPQPITASIPMNSTSIYSIDADTSSAVYQSTTTVPVTDLILNKYPYRFKASTDYFLPLFVVYAGTGGAGFAGAMLGQISDMLGNNTLSTSTAYSSDQDYLSYQANYQYARWRPLLNFSTSGSTGYELNSSDELLRVRRYVESFFVTYPFDQFNRTDFGIAREDEFIRNRDQRDLTGHNKNDVAFISLTRDRVSGELFDINYGQRTNFEAVLGRNLLGGEVKYDTYRLGWQGYWTTWRNFIFASQFLGINSNGRDYQTFSLGDRDFLRGFSRADDIEGRIIALGNFETRFYIFRNIDYDVWFMLPDIFFKSLQAVIFTDNGLVASNWNEFEDRTKDINNIHNSVGLGLRLNSFIQQRFPIILRLDYAKRTDLRDHGVWYFNLGASF